MPNYDPATDTKICGRCQTRKSGSSFNRRSRHGNDPYSGYCKECSATSYREWVRVNKEAKHTYLRNHRLANLARYRQYDAERYKKEEVKERGRQVRRENAMRYSGYGEARRARKSGAIGSFTIADIRSIKEMQNNKCAVCRVHLKELPY